MVLQTDLSNLIRVFNVGDWAQIAIGRGKGAYGQVTGFVDGRVCIVNLGTVKYDKQVDHVPAQEVSKGTLPQDLTQRRRETYICRTSVDCSGGLCRFVLPASAAEEAS